MVIDCTHDMPSEWDELVKKTEKKAARLDAVIVKCASAREDFDIRKQNAMAERDYTAACMARDAYKIFDNLLKFAKGEKEK